MSKSQALVAHTCNPSFLGGRHQENHSSKPAQVNSLLDPISKKKKITKNGVPEWLKVKAPSSNPGTGKKKIS
jgi:hypothetical protein